MAEKELEELAKDYEAAGCDTIAFMIREQISKGEG